MEKFDGFGFGFDGNDNSFSALLQNGDSGAPYLEILNMFREVVKSEIQASNRETRSSVNSELAKINEQLEMIRNCLLSSKSSSLPSCSRSLLKQGNSSASRILKLRFEGSLPKRLFTCKSLREQGASLKVLLCDTCGVAIEEGPESSITVKIVVLNGDFTPDDRNDSTGKEFNANVLRKRDGKRPLLVGKCEIPLRKGVVSIDDVMFTDNSSWMRSGKFRFGAKATKNVPSGVVISEAISDDFEVKERRGESNQKRETPLLDDEIWRLHNIRKNGPVHVRLQGASVHLVKDFLRLYDANEDSLKKIVRVSDSKWQVIIEHAKRALTVEPSECCNYAHRAKQSTVVAYQNPNEVREIGGSNPQISLPAEATFPSLCPHGNDLNLDATFPDLGLLDMELSPDFTSAMLMPLQQGETADCLISHPVEPHEIDTWLAADKPRAKSIRIGGHSVRAVVRFLIVHRLALLEQRIAPLKRRKLQG